MQQSTKRQEMETVIISKLCKSVNPNELKNIVTKCTQQAANDFFDKIESTRLEVPSSEEVKKLVADWDFDDTKIRPYIKRNFPGWSEDRIDEELDHLELLFEKEYAKQIEALNNTVVNGCKQLNTVLKKEIQELKQRLWENFHREQQSREKP